MEKQIIHFNWLLEVHKSDMFDIGFSQSIAISIFPKVVCRYQYCCWLSFNINVNILPLVVFQYQYWRCLSFNININIGASCHSTSISIIFIGCLSVSISILALAICQYQYWYNFNIAIGHLLMSIFNFSYYYPIFTMFRFFFEI